MPAGQVSFLFDLDGTVVDSVYEHVLAWHEALEVESIELSFWRIHRKIGMSDEMFTNMLLRELGLAIEPHRIERLRELHAEAFVRRAGRIRPLPGARDLLAYMTNACLPWTIATSGRMETAEPLFKLLGVDRAVVAVVTGDKVKHGKPEPDLFLAAADVLHHPIESACVVGDSVWDMLAARRAGALGVGLLSGGYSEDELFRAGACRVYDDPADLLKHIDEVGGGTFSEE
jgi:HAD superfamily hydrolase (TIGR01549 family)